MNLTTEERLQLNTYLEKLTHEWDEKAAYEVVKVFSQLPIDNSKFEYVSKRTKDNSISGHTNELGDVSIKDKEVKVKRIGGTQENDQARVGRFKIKNIRHNNTIRISKKFGAICFVDFWGSDITTRGFEDLRPSRYILEFEITSLKPCALIEETDKEMNCIQDIPGEAPVLTKIFFTILILLSKATNGKFFISQHNIIHGVPNFFKAF